MIGIVVVTHCKLGEALIEAAESMLSKSFTSIISVSIDLKEPAEKLRENIAKAIKKVNNSKGVIILTDMFGGTPSNLSYSFLEEGRIEVISGVNLPVLIRSLELRENLTLYELIEKVENYGKKSISLASRILKGNKRD